MGDLKVVSTSWDDGDPNDLRIAELLRSKALPGTFYVPINAYQGKNRLETSELRMLCSEGFEIGAHTVGHKDLSKLSERDLVHEIRDCKDILEQSLGERVVMFCYPNGRYNAAVTRQVEEAGYVGARTTRMLSVTTEFRTFEMPTTVQAFPHKGLAYIRNQGRARSVSGLTKYLLECRRLVHWVDLGKQLFNDVLRHGGIWHLYGHSWEIEELGIWNELTEMLDYVSGRADVKYATNGQLSLLLRSRNGDV